MEDTIQETKFCDNCKKEVSVANFLMHSAHCHRNIVLCVKCQEPFPKNEIAEHTLNAHAKIFCPKCGKDFERCETETHNADECTKRLIKCNFCSMDVIADSLVEHIDYCGSRTERCEVCGQYVMAKYQAIHLQSNHSFLTIDDLDKHKPEASYNPSPGYSSRVNYSGIGLDKDVQSRHRIGPGKRNNDMPQINVSASDEDAKKTAKPILQALRKTTPGTVSPVEQQTLSAMPVEQLDHLVAMQLSDDEQNSVYSNSDTESDWQDRRTPALQLPSEDFDDLALPVGGMWFPLLSPSMRQAMGLDALHPSVRPPTSRLLSSDIDRRVIPQNEEITTSLPCEFCNDLFPAEVLLAHQKSCDNNEHSSYPFGFPGDRASQQDFLGRERNDIRNGENFPEEAAPIVNNLAKSCNSDQNTDDAIIPCEYCGNLFDSDYIILHESGCEFAADDVSSSILSTSPATENIETVAVPSVVEPPTRPPRSPTRPKHQPDPDMLHLENLFLKEAIQNSLKDGNAGGKDRKNVEVLRPQQLVTAATNRFPRPAKVLQVPIAVDPNYDRVNHVTTSKVDKKDNVSALFKVREAKAAYANGGPTRGNVFPPPNYDRESTEVSQSAGQAVPRRNDTMGARPKNLGNRMVDRLSPEDPYDAFNDYRSQRGHATSQPRNGSISREPVAPSLHLNLRRREDNCSTSDLEDSVKPVPPRRPKTKRNQ